MIAVSNTSPLILLEKADHLWLLEKIFNKVRIPPSVNKEWLRPVEYTIPDMKLIDYLNNIGLGIEIKVYPKIKKKKGLEEENLLRM